MATTSPSFKRYKMVVLPAESRPTLETHGLLALKAEKCKIIATQTLSIRFRASTNHKDADLRRSKVLAQERTEADTHADYKDGSVGQIDGNCSKANLQEGLSTHFSGPSFLSSLSHPA